VRREAMEQERVITAGIIRKVDKAFSNYLKDELVDELFAILPDILVVFDVISQLRNGTSVSMILQNSMMLKRSAGI
jgi:hypothetical protein